MPKTVCQECKSKSYILREEKVICPVCYGGPPIPTPHGPGQFICEKCNGTGRALGYKRYPCPAGCENGYIEY